MKVHLDTPIPKTCSICPLGRKLEHGPWYTCFITGKTSTSITTERPGYCPIEEDETLQ